MRSGHKTWFAAGPGGPYRAYKKKWVARLPPISFFVLAGPDYSPNQSFQVSLTRCEIDFAGRAGTSAVFTGASATAAALTTTLGADTPGPEPETVLTGDGISVEMFAAAVCIDGSETGPGVTGELGAALASGTTGERGDGSAEDCLPGAEFAAGAEGVVGNEGSGGVAVAAGDDAPDEGFSGAAAAESGAGGAGKPSGSPVDEEDSSVGAVPPTVLTMLETGRSAPICGRPFASFSIAWSYSATVVTGDFAVI